MSGTKRIKDVDVIRMNKKIKEKLYHRFQDLGLYFTEISRDAKSKGRNIQASALSRYFKNSYPMRGSLKHEDIMWLCFRYCINVDLSIKANEYDPKKAKEKLKMFFPETKWD